MGLSEKIMDGITQEMLDSWYTHKSNKEEWIDEQEALEEDNNENND
jgi:hypothetical protein